MKFAGKSPEDLSPKIRIAKEFPPGTASSQLETVQGKNGEIVVDRIIQQGEYTVQMNIAGRTPAEAMSLRKLIAGWARPTDNSTRELIPTHWPDVAYDAVLKEITPPEFKRGFATVDVIFTLPRPIAHDIDYVNSAVSTVGENAVVVTSDAPTHPLDIIISINFDTEDGTIMLFVDDNVYFAINWPGAAVGTLAIRTKPFAVIAAISEGMDPLGQAMQYVDPASTDIDKLCEAIKANGASNVVSCNCATQISVRWKDEWP